MDDYDEGFPSEPAGELAQVANRSARSILEASGHTGCPLLARARYEPASEAVVCGCGEFTDPPTDPMSGEVVAGGTQEYQPGDPIKSTLNLIDAQQVYTPVDVERHILDVVTRLETGALFERQCIVRAAAAQAAWDRLFFATIHTSQQTSELKRKAEAEVACEKAGLTAERDESRMMAAAIKATMHNLRAVLSGYQSTSSSIRSAYQAGGAPGRNL